MTPAWRDNEAFTPPKLPCRESSAVPTLDGETEPMASWESGQLPTILCALPEEIPTFGGIHHSEVGKIR